MSDERSFSGDQINKLKHLVNEGIQVMTEVETLNGGLNDTIKNLAEEMDIKPSVLKKAVRLAYKAEFGREQQDHSLLETILESVGRTL